MTIFKRRRQSFRREGQHARQINIEVISGKTARGYLEVETRRRLSPWKSVRKDVDFVTAMDILGSDVEFFAEMDVLGSDVDFVTAMGVLESDVEFFAAMDVLGSAC